MIMKIKDLMLVIRPLDYVKIVKREGTLHREQMYGQWTRMKFKLGKFYYAEVDYIYATRDVVHILIK